MAPIVRFPTSVWMRYAKSSGTEPAGNSMTSPDGVNTKTRSEKKSIFSDSTNSEASFASC
ncbi:hypothetical protein D3C74_399480 [compost metagenome]